MTVDRQHTEIFDQAHQCGQKARNTPVYIQEYRKVFERDAVLALHITVSRLI